MLRFVYQDPRFEKQMDLLQKSGKKAEIAAKKATDIVRKMINGTAPEEIGGFTRYGEYRIDNCFKFDLGSGYRMITSKQHDRLFVLYIGTHGDCHRWLENNKNRRFDFAKERGDWVSVKNDRHHSLTCTATGCDRVQADDEIDSIDERDLRAIFSALCER